MPDSQVKFQIDLAVIFVFKAGENRKRNIYETFK